MPKYPAWDDYGDPQCEQHGEGQPCGRCEDCDPYGDFPLTQEPTPIMAARTEQLVKTLLEVRDQSKAHGSLLPGTVEDIGEVIRLVEREPKLLAWADELEATGGVGGWIARELRSRLGNG